MGEVLKLVLSSAGLFALLVSIVQLVIKSVEGRRIKAGAAKERESGDQRSDRLSAETWNARYRVLAENHLQYDSARRSQVYRLQDQVNDEREAAGKTPIAWPDLPDAPPLFPPPTT